MDYFKHYDQLMSKAKNRVLDTFTENHHIIPRCMGGSDDSDNIVALTPEEHYVAHQLLAKMYPENRGLVYASMMMTVNRPSNKIYGWIRRLHAKAMSEAQTGEGNSQFGKRWYHNPITEKKKKFFSDDVPAGWIKGRSISVSKNCAFCGAKFSCPKTKAQKYCSKKCRSANLSKQMKGKTPHNAISLTDDQISELISRYQKGESISKIHKDYGIGQRKAYYIIKQFGARDC